MPDCGPLGDTFFEANTRAIVAASLVNSPDGGWVESVLTELTHLRLRDLLLTMVPPVTDTTGDTPLQYQELPTLLAFDALNPGDHRRVSQTGDIPCASTAGLSPLLARQPGVT